MKAPTLIDVVAEADFVSVHMPYIPDVTHHALDEFVLRAMKSNAALLNFSRAELVDGKALAAIWAEEEDGQVKQRRAPYVSDFADPHLMEHDRFLCLPHLGASTAEAEINCARMAVTQVRRV